MTTSPTVADVAAEAEFQLLAAKDQLAWLTGLAGAIHLSHMHEGGRNAEALASLAKFLDDTGFCGVDQAVAQFHQLVQKPAAPQNPTLAKRGAPSIDGPCSTVGERLKLARAWAGLTQAKLAKKVGIDQASISQLECGESQRTSYVAELARACGVNTDWLAFGQEVSV